MSRIRSRLGARAGSAAGDGVGIGAAESRIALAPAGHHALDGFAQQVIDGCARGAGVLLSEAQQVRVGPGEAEGRVDDDTLWLALHEAGLAVHEADAASGRRQEAVAGRGSGGSGLPGARGYPGLGDPMLWSRGSGVSRLWEYW
jgi:hypothetical protein